MKPTTVLLAIPPTVAIAQSSLDCFDNVCCINGQFSGPVISSFSASFPSRDSSRSASESSRQAALTSSLSAAAASRSASQDSVRASLSSQFSTDGAAMVTPRAVFKRTITTEVRSGLTCIGDAVSTVDSGSSGTTDTATSTGDGSVSGASATTSTSSSSTGGVVMMTQAPLLAIGAAAIVFAYGAM